MNKSLALANYFAQEQNIFDVDLQGLNLLECLEKFQDYKAKSSEKASKAYNNLKKHLVEMESDYNTTIQPKHITDVFWSMFIPTLHSKGLKPSYVSYLCYQMRNLLNWCSKHNAVVSPTYGDFQLPQSNVMRLALTADEVSWCYHFDISTIKCRPQKKKTLEKVRDMFVLSCNLGQRHSDMIRISRENFERGIFKIVQQKTGNTAVVDIDKLSVDKKTTFAILEKYGYEAPYKADISNYEKHLKDLFRAIGLTDTIKTECKINGVLTTEMKRKCDHISAHDSRRTFASINYYRDVPKRLIMEATGHKTESSFNLYCVREQI